MLKARNFPAILTLQLTIYQGQPAERPSGSDSWSIRTIFARPDSHSNQSQGSYGRPYESSTEQRLRRERDEADKENDQLKEDIERLKLDLKRQQEAVSETKESATRVHQAMQDKELFLGPQALDRIVQGAFTGLFKNVRSWTRHLGSMKDVDLTSIDPVVRKQFENIAPGLDEHQLRKFLNNKSTTRYFFQGWVTIVIIEHLIPTLADENYPGTLTQDLWMDQNEAESFFKPERALISTGRQKIAIQHL